MSSPDRSTRGGRPGRALSERQSLSRRQRSRRDLDQFFTECIGYLGGNCRSTGHGRDALSEGIAAFAFQKFGALASNVLRHWGIGSPEELERCFCEFLKACGSHTTRRTGEFAQSEALKALFRGEYWP